MDKIYEIFQSYINRSEFNPTPLITFFGVGTVLLLLIVITAFAIDAFKRSFILGILYCLIISPFLYFFFAIFKWKSRAAAIGCISMILFVLFAFATYFGDTLVKRIVLEEREWKMADGVVHKGSFKSGAYIERDQATLLQGESEFIIQVDQLSKRDRSLLLHYIKFR